MAETAEVSSSSPTELLAVGRRHLAVKDYSSATSTLGLACELLAKDHGETADECAEALLWYGKALLGLYREESGVFGDGIPESGNDDEDSDEQDENGENEENADDGNDQAKSGADNGETADPVPEKSEAESTTKDDEVAPSSSAEKCEEEPGTSNGDANDESVMNMDAEDDVDNLQLAWEMLDLSRSILQRRADSGATDTRALLADVHLALGEVALESETYDKALVDMLKCLEIQKELYQSDNRHIAESHYQIALAHSLASNFEEAITHFKNAANILESRIKTLEGSNSTPEGNGVSSDVESEIKDLKELLPEIQVKIQDMMDYKAETIKKVRETLYPSNGEGSSSRSNDAATSSASSQPSTPATNISHLIKRKRKVSETEVTESAPKRSNT